MATKMNIEVKPRGTASRNCGPDLGAAPAAAARLLTTNDTMTATALTVTICAQK